MSKADEWRAIYNQHRALREGRDRNTNAFRCRACEVEVGRRGTGKARAISWIPSGSHRSKHCRRCLKKRSADGSLRRAKVRPFDDAHFPRQKFIRLGGGGLSARSAAKKRKDRGARLPKFMLIRPSGDRGRVDEELLFTGRVRDLIRYAATDHRAGSQHGPLFIVRPAKCQA
jgi:hypothetical protein